MNMHGVNKYNLLLRSVIRYPFNDFRSVRSFCFFIGYPRSGHSLIGALLDAHPEMVISYELDVLDWVQNHQWVNRSMLFSMIIERSKWWARCGNTSAGYSYRIKDGFQGSYKSLKVIGDKKGGISIKRLRKNPNLLKLLQEKIQVPLKIIHVTRNPYDNISTRYIKEASFSLGRKFSGKDFNSNSFENFITAFKEDAKTVNNIKRSGEYEILDIRQEDFIKHPGSTLSIILDFLNVSSNEHYMNSCIEIVYDSPHKSRDKINWSKEHIDKVQDIIDSFDFLKGHSFQT